MNNPFDLLQSNLLDLLYELKGSGIRITIGGGYGLYLKRQEIEASKANTLLSFPAARSTNDLDVFLQTQVIADIDNARTVWDALQRLKCMVVEGAENFQFVREFQINRQSHQVKFDFLTAKPTIEYETEQIEVRNIRVKNKKRRGTRPSHGGSRCD